MYAIKDARGYEFEMPIPDHPCSGSNNTVAFLPIERWLMSLLQRQRFMLNIQ